MELVSNVRVGEPEVSQTAAAHTAGVREGNKRRLLIKEPGWKRLGALLRATPRRSTGINAASRAPIDPRMPVLTPP